MRSFALEHDPQPRRSDGLGDKRTTRNFSYNRQPRESIAKEPSQPRLAGSSDSWQLKQKFLVTVDLFFLVAKFGGLGSTKKVYENRHGANQ